MFLYFHYDHIPHHHHPTGRMPSKTRTLVRAICISYSFALGRRKLGCSDCGRKIVVVEVAVAVVALAAAVSGDYDSSGDGGIGMVVVVVVAMVVVLVDDSAVMLVAGDNDSSDGGSSRGGDLGEAESTVDKGQKFSTGSYHTDP